MSDGRPRTASDIALAFRKRGIGIGSEMVSDVIGPLVASGVLTKDTISNVNLWQLASATGKRERKRKSTRNDDKWHDGVMRIVARVANRHQVSAMTLFGRSTGFRISQARDEAMHECWRGGFNFSQIGEVFGYRDPSGVGHKVRRFAARIAAEAAE